MIAGRRSLLVGLCLVAGAGSARAVPTEIHVRELGGWDLVAVSARVTGYTACLVDPPDLPLSGETPPMAAPVRARELAGHRVLRADAADADVALASLLSSAHAPGPRDGRSDPPGSAPLRHLLYLAGARWPSLLRDREPDRPRLILAADAPAAALMEALVTAGRALPDHDRGGADPEPDEVMPLGGWWRHLPDDEPVASVVGVPIDTDLGEDPEAARVLARDLALELGAEGADVTTVPMRSRRLVVARWPMSADSLPALRARVEARLARYRTELLAGGLVDAHRQWLLAEDTQSYSQPDRWFPTAVLLSEWSRRPRLAIEVRRAWDAVTPESIREAALAGLGESVVAVTTGAAPAAGFGPTELWSGDPVTADALSGPESLALVAAVGRRARRNVVVDSPAVDATPFEGAARVVVESDWWWWRDGAVLAGALTERIDPLGRAIRREFVPDGTEMHVAEWLDASGAGRTLDGESEPFDDADRRRLRVRGAADPVGLAARFGDEVTSIRYEGGAFRDGRWFQRVMVTDSVDVVTIDLDVETGLPTRVTLDGRAGSNELEELRFGKYRRFEGVRYPARLEWFRGPTRVESSEVRHASLERLQAPGP